MIQEGLRKIEKGNYGLTKNNVNIDGSSNMSFTQEWRRFNQCFVSSGNAFVNKLIDNLIKSGLEYKASGRDPSPQGGLY